MRKLLYTLAICLTIATYAKAEEKLTVSDQVFGSISFYQGDYEEFMSVASIQSKPIMLLFCRQGCHTCNNLKRSVNKKDVGEYFSNYFMSYYVDSDKEKFKLFPLSEKYGVNATPFFVFMTPNGKILYKGTLNPDRDSLLEKCSQIVIRNKNYQKVAQAIADAVTPQEQQDVAKELVAKFKSKLAYMSAEQFLSEVFLTANLKNYKTFNNTFLALASEIAKNNTPEKPTGLQIDQAVASSNKIVCDKRAAKWQKWMNQ